MARFRKRPVEIEAVQFDGFNGITVIRCLGSEETSIRMEPNENRSHFVLKIETLEGTMTAEPNDWIIKGVSGEVYPCKPDIFEKTYERV